MFQTIHTSIDTLILNILRNGPLNSIDVVKKVQNSRAGTPKQSVYLALRKLKAKEIIVVGKKQISLHQTWISNMKKFFSEVEASYSNKQGNSLLNLEDKEYVTYRFNSLVSLDMYWAHAFMLFLKHQTRHTPIFVYNPHQWFLIARETSETQIIKEAKKLDVSWLQIIAGKSHFDQMARKYFDGIHAKCHLLDKNTHPNNYYVNCFGDFIIEVWIDENSAEEIENLYSSHSQVDMSVVDLLKSLIEKKGCSHRMKISRNKTKAKKIKSLFKKYFLLNS